ncbi:Inositolphosphorylceramide synthase subunit Kei1-domain-containing protein [Armillaria fumosa]|nr:Inositolphosphorylceramide synthase subunit Kei1-domain-containing protein [Armillaria fumosa]
MKLTLRPEWRLWPFSSFLGLLDIKTGVVVALMFVLLNKVAGVYGLIAVVTGAGGSFAQLSLYIYSVVALLAFGWALNAVKEEDPKHTLYFAHLYFADHVFSTSWTIFFAVTWWFQTPHDGSRQANSPAQTEIIDGAIMAGQPLNEKERIEAAMKIWNHEKGMAATVIALGWLSKIYFILLVYSYASHLRKGSYRLLSRSRHTAGGPSFSANHAYETLGFGDEEEGEIEDFYRTPARTPNTGNSISSFTDFVNAPPSRPRRMPPSSLSRGGVVSGEEDDNVLFDDDEMTYTSSSRGHSKLGTDESSSTTDEERIRV